MASRSWKFVHCCRDEVKTHVEITPEDESGSFSIVHIKTRDRPGLLTDVVRTLKDLNVNVISAEVSPAPAWLIVSDHILPARMIGQSAQRFRAL